MFIWVNFIFAIYLAIITDFCGGANSNSRAAFSGNTIRNAANQQIGWGVIRGGGDTCVSGRGIWTAPWMLPCSGHRGSGNERYTYPLNRIVA